MARETKTEKERLRMMWNDYTQEPSVTNRNRLVLEYLPWVRRVAARLHSKLSSAVQYDDVQSAAVIGLMDGISRYDRSRGVKFTTYCSKRVAGQVDDELRNMDWTPRLVRLRRTQFNKQRDRLATELGRAPHDEELKESLRLSWPEFNKFKKAQKVIKLYDLYADITSKHQYAGETKSAYFIDVLIDDTVIDPEEQLVRKDLAEMLMWGFTRTETLALLLYYYHDETMKDIGKVVGISESRISQILAACKQRIKSYVPKEALL